MESTSTSGQLPRELAGFELPPHRSWARFYDDPRTVRGGAFEDPIAERTFLRFQTRSKARWDVVALNIFCLPAATLASSPLLTTALQLLFVLVTIGLLAAAYLPDRAMLSGWLTACRLQRAVELRPSQRIEASEVRAVMQASAVFLGLVAQLTFNSITWAVLSHLVSGERAALVVRSLPYGSMLGVMLIVRCRSMQHVVLLPIYWLVLAAHLAAGLFAGVGPMREMGAVDAAAVFTAVVCINVAVVVCTTAMERRERWLFLCVVGSRREGLAARLRSVAATAAAVAPPFAAAQLHTVMTPGEAAALAPVTARAAVCVADLADFAKFATGLLPQNTVRVLHKLFVAYDEGARRFGVDRAGSFADGYAVVSGLGAEDDPEVSVSAALVAAARRVSDFALWQVKAGAPAVAWEVFGAEEVFLSPRAAVSVGRVAGGLVGAGPCLRFLIHGPAVDSAVALLKQGGGDEALITPKAAAAQGMTPAAAKARGFSLGPGSSPGASSSGSPSQPLSIRPSTFPQPADGTAKRHANVGVDPGAAGAVAVPPPRALPAEDPVRALPTAAATRLLQPAAAKVRLRPFTLAFEDPETEARALAFARKFEVELTCAGSRLFATYYTACTVLCCADIALRGQSLLPASLFAAAALVEGSRSVLQSFDAPWAPLSALASTFAALVLVPEGAMVTNSLPGLAVLLVADMHLFPPHRLMPWYASFALRWATMQALLWAAGWKRALSHLFAPYVIIQILSLSTPMFHYTSQVGSRLRFQAAEHAEHLRRVLAEQADAQERLAKMLTPPHAAGGVAQRWAALATTGAPAEECTMWHWHEIVTVHARLRPRSVARRGLRGAAAVLDGFQQTAWRWGRLQEVLAGAVGRHGGAPGLLEHVESFGDTFIVAGPFPYDAGAAGGDAQQKLAVTAARAAVDFCQSAARALRSDAEIRAALKRAHDDNVVDDGERSCGDEAVLLSAALGAGPGQGALVGVEGLAFRLLGLAPREAAALLAALPDGSPCGVQQSVAVASPAFRRLHGAYNDEPLAAAVLAAELQLRHAAASEALLLSRLPAAVVAAPEAVWGHSVASSASSSVQVFRPAGKWRVRGLGVVMASHLRGMNDSDDDDDSIPRGSWQTPTDHN